MTGNLTFQEHAIVKKKKTNQNILPSEVGKLSQQSHKYSKWGAMKKRGVLLNVRYPPECLSAAKGMQVVICVEV